MEVNYEREVRHCSKSKYIQQVTVTNIKPADNSDKLDVIKFEESGYQAVVKRDSFKVGDKVCFIPPESVLPFELSEALEVTNYLGRGRVKIAVLRGNRSEGLVVNWEVVKPYLNYILQWEDLPTSSMGGDSLSNRSTPHKFIKFYKMPNLMNEPLTFEIGEKVFFSEKHHGTNNRFAVMVNPKFKQHWLAKLYRKIRKINQYQLYVGSHEVVLLRSEKNLYWKVVLKTIENVELPKDYVFFAEIHGFGVQKNFEYGLRTQELKVFNVWKDWNYLNLKDAKKMCEDLGLPFMNIHEDTFQGLEWAKAKANEPSELYDGIREGIVIVSAENPNKMAKVIGDQYLANKKEDTTERH